MTSRPFRGVHESGSRHQAVGGGPRLLTNAVILPLIALAAILALVLTACGSADVAKPAFVSSQGAKATATQSAAASAQAADSDSVVDQLAASLKKDAVADPLAIKGPSTAASVPEIVPIDNPSTPKLPANVTDYQGTQVTVTDTSRVLALDMYGTLAETVIGLGKGDSLVGRVTSSTEASIADLPLVTENGHDLSVEAILALHPTLVLMDTTNGPIEVADQLRSAGITVVMFTPDRNIDGIGPNIEAVAAALGVPEDGKRLSQRVEKELEVAKSAIDQVAPKGSDKKVAMAFLYVRGTAGVFFILGDGSGADDLIAALDGRDVASDGKVAHIIPANSEALVSLNPDLILTMTGGVESTGGLEGLLARPGVGETTAGKNKRVVTMADGQILSFGPNTPAVLLSLAHAVYSNSPS